MKHYSDLIQAKSIAGEVIDLLQSAFVNLHVAGSVRRGKPQVSDIELVGIPVSTTLFKQLTSSLEQDGIITKHDYKPENYHPSYRWGDAYRGFNYKGMLIEVFCAEPETFGYIYWLRTGPGEANTAVMYWLKQRQSPVRMADGAVWYVEYHGDEYQRISQLRVPDEHTLFDLINVPFVPPSQRNEQHYQWYMGNDEWEPPSAKYVDGLKLSSQLKLF